MKPVITVLELALGWDNLPRARQCDPRHLQNSTAFDDLNCRIAGLRGGASLASLVNR